ncbi:hypothetical protein J2S74_002409 [Evansella vedderi]|uniref:EcsC family protein n=1 Tax=Evansella vedderi TaxID=38282 RepID=A0ABT9ZW98_9BACI|nr:EcsC family protein [Evansella vedderi]MDQ0255027.1 hypothetical protein [Evansella vedderi]
MSWTERERQVFSDIKSWENLHFYGKGTDFSRTYQKMVNAGFQTFGSDWNRRMLKRLDDFLFHLQAIVQQGRFDKQVRDNLFSQGRIFRSDIHTIEDMKKLSIDQLRFIAKKQLARQRLVALGQGGLTGLGGVIFTLSDLPLMLAINLRTVQLMALTYGYDLRKPYEMMYVLKVFHAISLPHPLQKDAWDQLFDEMKETDEDWIFYEGDDDITSQGWLQQPLNQILKLFIVMFARRKLVQGIPVFGIAAGASFNYQFARHITDASHAFYQKRWLIEKEMR